MQGKANCLDKRLPYLSGGSGKLERGGFGGVQNYYFPNQLTSSDGNSCI